MLDCWSSQLLASARSLADAESAIYLTPIPHSQALTSCAGALQSKLTTWVIDSSQADFAAPAVYSASTKRFYAPAVLRSAISTTNRLPASAPVHLWSWPADQPSGLLDRTYSSAEILQSLHCLCAISVGPDTDSVGHGVQTAAATDAIPERAGTFLAHNDASVSLHHWGNSGRLGESSSSRGQLVSTASDARQLAVTHVTDAQTVEVTLYTAQVHIFPPALWQIYTYRPRHKLYVSEARWLEHWMGMYIKHSVAAALLAYVFPSA